MSEPRKTYHVERIHDPSIENNCEIFFEPTHDLVKVVKKIHFENRKVINFVSFFICRNCVNSDDKIDFFLQEVFSRFDKENQMEKGNHEKK